MCVFVMKYNWEKKIIKKKNIIKIDDKCYNTSPVVVGGALFVLEHLFLYFFFVVYECNVRLIACNYYNWGAPWTSGHTHESVNV